MPLNTRPEPELLATGGHLEENAVPAPWRVTLAFHGRTRFAQTRWSDPVTNGWVVDLITRGSQLQRLENGPVFERGPGLAALYPPGTVHHEHQTAGDAIDEAYVVFAVDPGPTADHLARFTRAIGSAWIHDPEQALAEHLRLVARLMTDRRPGFEFQVAAQTCEIMARLLDAQPLNPGHWQLRPARPPDADDLRAQVERYVADHLAEPIGVPEVARHLDMSVSSLAHRYSAEAGESPYRTILRLKLARARELLLHDRLSVKETANRLGFANEFSFSRTFKRHEGIAPSSFVRALSERGG